MAKVNDVKQHANPVTMELGGKKRTLQFDMNAFAELEKRFGSIDDAMEQLASGKMGDIKIILWAALIHEEVEEFDEFTGEPTKYGITPYQVGSFIKNPMMLQEVSAKLGEAMSFGMPDPESLPEEVKAKLREKGFDPDDAAAPKKAAPRKKVKKA